MFDRSVDLVEVLFVFGVQYEEVGAVHDDLEGAPEVVGEPRGDGADLHEEPVLVAPPQPLIDFFSDIPKECLVARFLRFECFENPVAPEKRINSSYDSNEAAVGVILVKTINFIVSRDDVSPLKGIS